MQKRHEDGSFSEGNEEKKKWQPKVVWYRKETEGKRKRDGWKG